MTTEKKLLGTNPVATGDPAPEAVSFDGVSDQLSRSSDLTGNADGKTFTFSAWVYQTGGNKNIRMINLLNSGTTNFEVYANDGYLYITGWNTAHSTQVIEARLDLRVPIKTWSHVLISADMTSTSNRYVYVDDIDYSSTINWYSYSNADINFTNNNPVIGSTYASAGYSKGRLAHLFLDYTYRDLSTTSNRRLFIDADGKPADGQADLSPILYLPMKNADTAGSNSGTGGDFTVNGILATAERGPNQDNCVASVFDGSADYLSRSSLSGISNATSCTASINFKINKNNTSNFALADFSLTTGPWTAFYLYITSSNQLVVNIKDASEVIILQKWGYQLAAGSEYNLTLSFSNSTYKVLLNNVDISSEFTYNSGKTTVFGNAIKYNVGCHYASSTFSAFANASIGEFYFNTTYMDLSTENPFWDSDANRPNSVRKVIADTGVTPLIALPIIGSDAGNNLGSGGDFTVNSGPFTGARGGSEYWARSATSGSASSNLTKTGFSNPALFSGSFGFGASGTIPLQISGDSVIYKDNEIFQLALYSGSSLVLKFRSFANYSLGSHSVLYSVDMTNNTATCYIDGTALSLHTNNMSSFSTIDLDNFKIIGDANSSMSAAYFNTSYIDFSQESNRNKFIDQLGYPRDLTQQIENGDIPNPLIYMKFDDTAALGTNSGTGGNFTVNGTVTAGADFTI